MTIARSVRRPCRAADHEVVRDRCKQGIRRQGNAWPRAADVGDEVVVDFVAEQAERTVSEVRAIEDESRGEGRILSENHVVGAARAQAGIDGRGWRIERVSHVRLHRKDHDKARKGRAKKKRSQPRVDLHEFPEAQHGEQDGRPQRAMQVAVAEALPLVGKDDAHENEGQRQAGCQCQGQALAPREPDAGSHQRQQQDGLPGSEAEQVGNDILETRCIAGGERQEKPGQVVRSRGLRLRRRPRHQRVHRDRPGQPERGDRGIARRIHRGARPRPVAHQPDEERQGEERMKHRLVQPRRHGGDGQRPAIRSCLGAQEQPEPEQIERQVRRHGVGRHAREKDLSRGDVEQHGHERRLALQRPKTARAEP